jgi:hypothetical protein
VLGVVVGMLLGFVEPFVLSFPDIVLSGQAVGLLLLLVTVPGTALVGGLRAVRRKPQRQAIAYTSSVDPWTAARAATR